MEQTNAFNILGATPDDSIETLQELLEEKELMVDDSEPLHSAFSDLTNPKKRLIHEIKYFCEESLEDFYKLVSHGYNSIPVEKVANILVSLGNWFELDNSDLVDDINESRKNSGVALIIDGSVVDDAVESLQNECVMCADSYLDRLKESSLVNVFNRIVKTDGFASAFSDTLMAHYEILIRETLSEKELECRSLFNDIKSTCNSFIGGSMFSCDLTKKIESFRTQLNAWDKYSQPLQINMQIHGGQHEESTRLLHDFRNDVIEICNNSQADIVKLLNGIKKQNSINQFLHTPSAASVSPIKYMSQDEFVYSFRAREQLIQKLPGYLKLTRGLIDLIRIFKTVFSELDLSAEILAQDEENLIDLKNTLDGINSQIQPNNDSHIVSNSRIPSHGIVNADKFRENRNGDDTSCDNNTICRGPFSSWSFGRICYGILSIVFLVIMIIGFVEGSIALGVAFLISMITFAICCIFYLALEDELFDRWKARNVVVTVGIILSTVIGILIKVFA